MYALVPVLGTAFIILYAHPGTVIGALLATRPFVWIGLISYSAYLWHQPLFALERHRCIAEPGIQVMVGLALFSLIMGYLSWRWIEAPFRNKKKISRRQIFGLSAVGMAAFLSIGLAGVASDGFRSRDKWAGVAGAFATQAERGSGTRYCTANRVVSTLGELVCVIGDNAKKPEGVLWGDSYAGALVHGLDNELRRQGKAFYVVLSDGCVPVENAWRIALQADFNCTKDRHNTFMRAVLADASIEKIVWVGAFHLLLDPSQSFEYVIDGRPISGQTAKKRMLKMLSSFKANGKDVVLVGEPPRFPFSAADYALRRYSVTNGDTSAGIQEVSLSSMLSRLKQEDLLDEAKAYARVINALDLFCENNLCRSHDAKGQLLFTDNLMFRT